MVAFFLVYITPIIAIIFFINAVALAKKNTKGEENTANHTGWGAIMFAYLIFAIIMASSFS